MKRRIENMKRNGYASARQVLGLVLVFWVCSIGKVSAQSALTFVAEEINLGSYQQENRYA